MGKLIFQAATTTNLVHRRAYVLIALVVSMVTASGFASVAEAVPPTAWGSSGPGQVVLMYQGSATAPKLKVGTTIRQVRQQMRSAKFQDTTALAKSDLNAAARPDATPKATVPEVIDGSVQNYYLKTRAGKRAANAGGVTPSDASNGVVDFAGCASNPAGGGSAGTILNHFNYCEWKVVSYIVFVNGVLVASYSAKRVTIGFGSTTARAVTVSISLRDFAFVGAVVPSSVWTAGLSIGAFPVGGTSIAAPSAPVSMRYTAWPQNFISYTIVGSSNTTYGLDKLTLGVWNTYVHFQTAGASPSSDTVSPQAGNRYDSAPYLTTTSGAIFDRVIPVMNYSLSDPKAGPVARHIQYAFSDPNATFPIKSGSKDIPGNARKQPFEFLTRLYSGYDQAQYNLNRTTTASMCTKLPPVAGSQCDEYPFASTYEGSAKGDGNYSLQRLDATANLSAGGKLSAWFSSDRILHKDKFLISINA